MGQGGEPVNIFNWNNITTAAFPGFRVASKVISADGTTVSVTNMSGSSSTRLQNMDLVADGIISPDKSYKVKILGYGIRNSDSNAYVYYGDDYITIPITDEPFEYTISQGCNKTMFYMYFNDYSIGTVSSVKMEVYEL